MAEGEQGQQAGAAPDIRAALEERNWTAAHGWHGSRPLIVRGVDLGDCLTYSAVMILGAIWKSALDVPAAAPAAAGGDAA